jgi:NADPH:quinone reductase-like Zn-dependent oxidoreductase
MKAAVVDTLGIAPRVTAQPDPPPVTGDLVLVRVEAAALNAVDLHIASGHHRAAGPQRRRGESTLGAERPHLDGWRERGW